MTDVQIRTWHEWQDADGAWQTNELSFDAWKAEMRPHRDALLAVWVCKLGVLLEQHPGELPYEALQPLHADAETLRSLDDGEDWKRPFNRLREAFWHADHDAIRTLVRELEAKS